MFVQRLVLLFPMFVLLIVAAVIDLRSRRIPNWLTFSLAATGLLQGFLPGAHLAAPLQSMLGLLTGLGLNILLFTLHIRGGGDVKLFAGLGAWIGPWLTFEVFVVSAIVAAIAALMQAMLAGKLTPLLRNTAVLAVSLAHPKELGIAHVTADDGSFRTVGRPVPYAVPAIVATALVLAFG